MKRTSSKTAFTLIELIIALALVAVVVLGIFSINIVLSNNNQDYGQRYLVRSSTQATLSHILNDASLAVGSGTTDSFGNIDQGILIGAGTPPGVGDANSFCIHQNGNTNIWMCYTWYPSADPTYPNQIVYCTYNYVSAASANSYRGAASCKASNNPVSGPTFLGTAYSNPSVSFSSATGFSITIQNCLNDSAASTCFSANPDPVNNPEVTVSGSVAPSQVGAG